MTKTVLDVGNCVPDHAAIRHMIETHFDARVVQANQAADAISTLQRQPIALVLVNRKLDIDYSDGLHVIRQIKEHPELKQVPVMMVTNYEDHQALAIEAGAEPGFGKLAIGAEETLNRLRPFLDVEST